MIGSTDGTSKFERRRRTTTTTKRVPETFHLLSAVVVWLVTGTTISSLNKWIFAVYNFRYPLLLSALHMLTAIVVDYGLIKYWFVRRRGLDERGLTSSAKCKVFLLSLTFCASIAFGNVGLNYVQLSFAQMIYTTTPIFTLAISSLVLGKQHHILKYTAMMPICLGASFSIMGEVQFDQTGCLFVFAATMLRGVKSIQQSILLQEEKIHSVFLLYLMAIPSFCILAVAALVLENWAGLQSPLHYDRHLWGFILLSCLGSVLYNLASCCVISLTSAVTLHILGNLNVVGNLLLSQLLFDSQLSTLSCAGAALTLSGLIIYQNSEFIAGFLDARWDRKASGKDAEPDSGSTSDLSSELEPPPERSSEEGHFEETWAEQVDDLEPYLDLEPCPETSPELNQDFETSPGLSSDIEPSSDTSPELHHDFKPCPKLSSDLEPFPDTSPELQHDLEPCPKLSSDIEPSPDTSPELHHDLEPCPKLSSDIEPSPDTSPELHHDLEPCPETSLELPHNLGTSLELSSDLDLSPETSPDLHHDLEPCLESQMSSELFLDLEPSPESSPKLFTDLESPEPLPELCSDLELSSEPYHDLDLSPEPSTELCSDIEPSLEPHHDDEELSPEPSAELCSDQEPSLDLYHDLELSPEPSTELCSNIEPSFEPQHDLELSPELYHDLEPFPKCSPESELEVRESCS
ncbi:solute carrier family 35 member E4 isoform X2 [Salminus brasiliensis]